MAAITILSVLKVPWDRDFAACCFSWIECGLGEGRKYELREKSASILMEIGPGRVGEFSIGSRMWELWTLCLQVLLARHESDGLDLLPRFFEYRPEEEDARAVWGAMKVSFILANTDELLARYGRERLCGVIRCDFHLLDPLMKGQISEKFG
jgi:hypothetical protein